MPKITATNCLWFFAYLFCVGGVLFGISSGRKSAIELYGNESAQAEWNDWRDAATTQSRDETSPVKRRAPKSEMPPALALMNDYYISCVVFCLIMVTALFAATMFLVRGVFAKTPTIATE